ncbi:hypothetical protein HPB48_000934 [Haemaphysalis longicornis]|uniref:Uncharacterized protein n=1 Tax=Haemaphysalis longicornis TaxID=44386 RepID=A0A9J6GSV0_HAELO|nr:hypothetical protein HPB48_000934 [Haemaphysalis longicornis]
MHSIADRFDISESSVHACIEGVLKLLHSLSAEVTSWPDEREQERIKAGFLLRVLERGHATLLAAWTEAMWRSTAQRKLRSRTSPGRSFRH